MLFITYFPRASEKHLVRVFYPPPPPIWSHLCLPLLKCNYPLAKFLQEKKNNDRLTANVKLMQRESGRARRAVLCAALPSAGNIKRDESHRSFVLAQLGVNKNVWIHERVGAESAENGK